MSNTVIFSVLVLSLIWASSSEGAQILVVFPPPVPSQFNLGKTLVQELVNRGHDVTFISCFGTNVKKKNITDIVLTSILSKIGGFKRDILQLSEKSIIATLNIVFDMSEKFVEKTFNSSEVQDLFKSDKKFDLVIALNFFSEALIAFGDIFDCPVILFSPFGANIWVNNLVMNPEPPSYNPQMLTNWPMDMTFWQRTQNFLLTIWLEKTYFRYRTSQQNIVRKYFPNTPPLHDIINRRLALILLNSNPSFSPAKPLVPNMIEIGGFHIPRPKPLPEELKTYLDNAKEGFILFSMGSNLQTAMFPVETIEIFQKVLAQLPYKVLWKFEDDQMSDKPDNVRIEKWLPQNDILPHPNLKLFISHGGISSMIEAVYHGVPIVGIPVFGDQKMNAVNIEQLGIGKFIDFKEVSYEKLLALIRDVLYNESYRERAKHRSAICKDQPLRPLDTAMFWVEYVIRHKYSNHLKTTGINLNLYQIHSLDVIVFLAFIGLVITYILLLILRKIFASIKYNTYENSNAKKEK